MPMFRHAFWSRGPRQDVRFHAVKERLKRLISKRLEDRVDMLFAVPAYETLLLISETAPPRAGRRLPTL